MNPEPFLSSALAPFGDAHLDEIEAVAAVLRDSPVLTEIEVRQGDAILRVRRGGAAARASLPTSSQSVGHSKNAVGPVSASVETVLAAGGSGAAAAVPGLVEEASEAATPVLARLVGVFHTLRPPLAPGDRAAKGQVVGHIEAMRLMNDVNAPTEGTVAAVHVEDGQPVEYGQALFEIAPTASLEKT